MATRKKQEEEPPVMIEPAAERNGTSVRFARIIDSLKKPENRKVYGYLIMFSGLWSLLSVLSYPFTWKSDQSLMLDHFPAVFGNPDLLVENWLGKSGAFLSHLMVYRGFGMPVLLLTAWFMIWGANISFPLRLPVRKLGWNALFLTVWLSMVAGYFFTDVYSFIGGVAGFAGNKWLHSLSGSLGSPLVLSFSFLLYVSMLVKAYKNKQTETEQVRDFDAEAQEEAAATSEPVGAGTKKTRKRKTWNELLEQETESLLKQQDAPEEKQPEAQINPATQTENPAAAEGKAPAEPLKSVLPAAHEGDMELIIESSPVELLSEVPEFIREDDSGALPHATGDFDPTLDLSSYTHPPLELLEMHKSENSTVTPEELQANKNRIINTLKNYSIEIDQIKATVGPSVTLYEIVPAPGIRISKIKSLQDDIALSLAAQGIRIIAPLPGKGTIGIEVPNLKPEVVPMRSILASEKFQNTGMDLPIAIGKTISNEVFVADLSKMPHLLMAGATGQGKSVGLNAILVSLLYKKHPAQVKFVLVDPKKVELTLYSTIERHFLAKLPNAEEAIITDNKKVIHTLNSLCILMDSRLELLKDAQVRNIKEYNAKFVSRRLNPNQGHYFMPYIVLVVDEFADLIMTAGKEVEGPIARLAQVARAVGIHLIIATQRPAVNIITGTIKANFPARIAFKVSSQIDSRTILDSAGAEKLVGRGDMLLSTGNDLVRIQCAFVDTPEVEKVNEFIGSQRGYPDAYHLPEYVGEGEDEKEDFDPEERDAFFNEAARLIVQHQQGSTSLIQRKLKLGYNRAGRIIDQLEAAGVVGPFEGSKARKVLFQDEASLEHFLNSMK